MDAYLISKREEQKFTPTKWQTILTDFLKKPHESRLAYCFNIVSIIFTIVSVAQFCLATVKSFQVDELIKEFGCLEIITIKSKTLSDLLSLFLSKSNTNNTRFQFNFYLELVVNSFFILEFILRWLIAPTTVIFLSDIS